MTEPDRKKWRVEPVGAVDANLYEGDRWLGRLVDREVAARIVALSNAGGEPVAWAVRDRENQILVRYEGAAIESWNNHGSFGAPPEPLYAAPVAPEPPAEVEWRVSEDLISRIMNALYILPRLRSRSRTEIFYPGSTSPELLRRSEEAFDEIKGAVEIARAALAHRPDAIAAGRSGGWRDVASAPKDGTAILLIDGDTDCPTVCRWDGQRWSVVWDHSEYTISDLGGRGVHWMPLPALPAENDEGER